MATVNLYGWQRREILNALRDEFDAKTRKIENEIAAIPVIQPLYNARTTEAEREAVELLGNEWLNSYERAAVEIQTEMGNTHKWYTSFQKRHLPHGFEYGRPPNVLQPGMVGYDEIAALVDRRATIRKERETLLAAIEDVLYKATTLNKVRDLWPSVTQYLDQNTIAQLNAPVVKKPRVKRDPLVLSDEAKASLIKLNLTRSLK